MAIAKPKINDLIGIKQVLEQWTVIDEVEKYLARISSEIKGKIEYSMNFWVIKEGDVVIGVGGLAEPLPIILNFAKTSNPGEIKILYISDSYRRKGFGREMINFLEKEAKIKNYQELFVRSAELYKKTAYGFYKKMGYIQIGKIENNMNVFNKILKIGRAHV